MCSNARPLREGTRRFGSECVSGRLIFIDLRAPVPNGARAQPDVRWSCLVDVLGNPDTRDDTQPVATYTATVDRVAITSRSFMRAHPTVERAKPAARRASRPPLQILPRICLTTHSPAADPGSVLPGTHPAVVLDAAVVRGRASSSCALQSAWPSWALQLPDPAGHHT